MVKQRVIIVDDVSYAREDLKDILNRRHGDFIKIVGESDSTAKAWEIIEQDNRIDGVFLDINLPVESERAGLDLAFKINRRHSPPWIIFVTGMNKHALEAHDLHPVHYLLKPLDDVTVDKALDLVRKHHSKEAPRFPIKHRFKGNRDFHLSFISRDEIVCITKDSGEATVTIKLTHGEALCDVSGTLAYWEEAFDLTKIHRSHLINVNQAKRLRIEKGKEAAYKVQFHTYPEELPVGDAFREKLFKAMEQ